MLDADLAHPGEVDRIARLAEVETHCVDLAGGVPRRDRRRAAVPVDHRGGPDLLQGWLERLPAPVELLTSGVYLPWDAPGGPDGPDHVVILVPDGYTQATAAGTAVPVANNAAILSRIGDGTVVFTGTGKPDRIIRLDPSFVSVYQGDLADTQEDNARIALTGLAQAARVYRDANGTTDGFAAQFRAQQGDALFNQMKVLTDTGATAALDDGRCLTVTFPDGDIAEAPC